MKILSIETSCDETSVAVAEFRNSRGQTQTKKSRTDADRTTYIRVLSHIVLSQIPVHQKFGGVVPNLAKREHQKNLVPILLRALKEAGFLNHKSQITNHKQPPNPKIQKLKKILEREQDLFERIGAEVIPLEPPDIDAIAVTYGPGLAPALWVGVNFAKALAYLWGKPLIPVNHMAGHLYSALLQTKQRISNFQFSISKQNKNEILQTTNYKLQTIKFSALALLVSGGHTELVLMRGHGKFKILGETLDDAAGEAFDKVARILDLSYPGGPEISRLAASYEATPRKTYDTWCHRIKLPRPMLYSKDYNFSFSGLKTAVLYLTRDLGPKKTKRLRPLIAKEFRDAVVEVLVKKTIRAAKEYKVKTILLGGGVSANEKLRTVLAKEIQKQLPSISYQLPATGLTGDNALMIAAAAYFTGKKKALDKVGADANLRLGKPEKV